MSMTPLQSAAYDAWRTAGPSEDPMESFYDSLDGLNLDQLRLELDSLDDPDPECFTGGVRKFMEAERNTQAARDYLRGLISGYEAELIDKLEAMSNEQLLAYVPAGAAEKEYHEIELFNRDLLND